MAESSGVQGLPIRKAAAARLARVLGGEAFAPFDAGDISDGRDRALANRLVTTALRRHGHIDRIFAAVLPKGVPPRSGLFEAAMRMGLAELLFVPGASAHSAIFLAVEVVKADRRGGRYARVVNGALRAAQRAAANHADLSAEDLFPGWLAKRWRAAYGEAVLGPFGQALLSGAPLDLTLRDDDPALVEALGAARVMGDTVRIIERDRPVEALAGFAEGRWWVQDAASALPGRLLGVQPGERVIDLCAAPGGKTAQLIKAGGEVTALDADPARLERFRSNLARLGYSAECVAGDATSWRPDELADRVLLDAPCSATGTFRRHPEVLLNRTPGDIADRAKLQRAMLENAARMVRPGGRLVYCVCSLEPEEGESIARWAARNVAELELVPVQAGQIPGLEGALTEEGFVRTHPGLDVPGASGGTLDGFFVAAFRRHGRSH